MELGFPPSPLWRIQMPYQVKANRRRQSKSKPRPRLSLQKATGVISPRVQKVGGERFAIVCVDPAKHRSEWMMADYFGNLFIEPQTVEHQASSFKLAIDLIRQTKQQHNIQDMIVVRPANECGEVNWSDNRPVNIHHSSLPGLTRQSIPFAPAFEGTVTVWMPGSSPGMTA